MRFDKEANKTYTYSDADSLLENLDDLAEIINHHRLRQVPRLDQLDDYYLGNNTTILSGDRRKEEHMADHRATHNHARYVSQFIVGYLTGNPIKIDHSDDKARDYIRNIEQSNELDALHSELTLDCSVYGRAYELLYRNENDETRVVMLSPLETFVIYDETVEQKPIAGVRYRKSFKNGETKFYIDVYTSDYEYNYESSTLTADQFRLIDEGEHYFEGVPIIEYQNNRFRQGDYENVLDLIDLYDAAQSDTANYMTDLNDAMLKIKGNLSIDVQEAQEMKEANILMLETSGENAQADADYIYKKYDVAGTEAYKTRIETDIHKFTNTPDMNDENFAGNQTGEAMKYKLFGLEQVRATKERFFKRSMRKRFELINNLASYGNELADGLLRESTITFTPNLPKSTKEAVDMFNSLGGRLSEKTVLGLLPFIDDPEDELERLQEEEPSMYDFEQVNTDE